MELYDAARLLPKVGDIRMEVPTFAKLPGNAEMPARKCKVVEVNRPHLWYRVQFENGFTECYKVPAIKPRNTGGSTK